MNKELIKGAAATLSMGGLMVEMEKMAGMPIRSHLDPPLNWPFIYGSDFGPATLTGMFAGVIGATVWEKVGRFNDKTRRGLAVATSSLIAVVPIGIGAGYELMDKCAAEKKANYGPEIEEIHVCKPDPVDAATVIIGGIVGIAGGIAMAELGSESRRKKRVS